MESNTQQNKIEALFFACLGFALCEGSFPEALRDCSEEELNTLYALSKNQDVAQVLGYVLHRENLLFPKRAVSAKLQKQEMIAVLRQERLDYELSQIRSVFETAGIRFLPLKGSVLRALYPVPWLRVSCDIDVLVDEERIDECVALLSDRLGYKAEERRDYHDISLYAPSGVHLELHFSILENMPTLDRELSRVWEFAAPISENSLEHRMTNEYLVFHTVAHMAYHFVHGGCGVRPFLDLYLMRKQYSIDEAILRAHLRACELEPFYESLLRLISVWFEGGEASELTDAMQEYLLSGGVYGSMENRVSVAQGKEGSRLRYLLRRIFLPYAELARQYPVLKKHKILLPICHIRRWFRVLFGGRAKHSMQELRVSSKLTGERLDQTGALMERLGL